MKPRQVNLLDIQKPPRRKPRSTWIPVRNSSQWDAVYRGILWQYFHKDRIAKQRAYQQRHTYVGLE